MKLLEKALIYYVSTIFFGSVLLVTSAWASQLIDSRETGTHSFDGHFLIMIVSGLVGCPLIVICLAYFGLIQHFGVSYQYRIGLSSAFGLLLSFSWIRLLNGDQGLNETIEIWMPFTMAAAICGPLLEYFYKRSAQ